MANTFTFVLYYTTKKKSVQERIYKEFEGCGQQITHDQLVKANYTKACLQETYRIKPTAICLARILEESTVLSGYTLKPGVILFVYCDRFKMMVINYVSSKLFRPLFYARL